MQNFGVQKEMFILNNIVKKIIRKSHEFQRMLESQITIFLAKNSLFLQNEFFGSQNNPGDNTDTSINIDDS